MVLLQTAEMNGLLELVVGILVTVKIRCAGPFQLEFDQIPE